jgi:hypothetical protein
MHVPVFIPVGWHIRHDFATQNINTLKMQKCKNAKKSIGNIHQFCMQNAPKINVPLQIGISIMQLKPPKTKYMSNYKVKP